MTGPSRAVTKGTIVAALGDRAIAAGAKAGVDHSDFNVQVPSSRVGPGLLRQHKHRGKHSSER
ncbi:MAG: hypothetical protein HC828_03375 [Blastochloris sp.]|nr:hypothetical protein [Blastochloris sp.]